MTKPIETSHWKVRLVFHGTVIHVLSHSEPLVHTSVDGRVTFVEMEPISDTPDGDTLGYLDWSALEAVTWRPPNL